MKNSIAHIRQENDRYRRALIPTPQCQIMLTPGVNESEHREAILEAVRNFDAFTNGNDPHREHDFGMVDYPGPKILF